MKVLGGISAQAFLSRYWQKSPYLVRQAFAGIPAPIDGDDLAGLATETDVESRLVTANDWQLRHGPFYEDDFAALPEQDWTLLVQAVDQWIPEVAALFEHFRFLPAWRLDDIMVSYAVPGGGVGPHFDQYDVFLIQMEGKREWRIGQDCTENDDCRDDTELSILAEFHEQERWVLEPGDMLYVPPGVAHWGTAITAGLTFSIGFRAPSLAEVMVDFAHYVADKSTEFERYQDPDLKDRKQPFALADVDLDRVQALLQSAANDRSTIAQWFGRYMTEPKYDRPLPEEPLFTQSALRNELERHPLHRNHGARLAYIAGTLFMNGDGIDTRLSEPELAWLCQQTRLTNDLPDSKAFWALLIELVNRDAFYFDEP
ncbi:MAG: JmjC domain-containing protein [Saccharospirillum sp.]